MYIMIKFYVTKIYITIEELIEAQNDLILCIYFYLIKAPNGIVNLANFLISLFQTVFLALFIHQIYVIK